MSEHRYPFAALWPDYLRAGLGLVVTAGPLPWLGASPVTFGILGTLALIFAGFAIATALRHATRITCNENGVSTTGLRSVSVPWVDMDRIVLRYFSTKRDRTGGWMQLDLGGKGRTLRIDSNLDGFEGIAQTAFDHAVARGLPLDPTTTANAAAAGFIAAPAGSP